MTAQKLNDDRPLYTVEDDDTPLYRLEDDLAPVPERGVSPYPAAEEQAGGDDDVDDEEYVDDEETEAAGIVSQEKSRSSLLMPICAMLRVLFTPVEGWKALKRSRFDSGRFARLCLVPCVLFAAVTEVTACFFEANVTVSTWLLNAVSTLVIFFFSYFTILIFGGYILPRLSRDILKKEIGKQFVMLALSTLALFRGVVHLFPMFEPVLVFLPLWTIYVVFKGVRILRVPPEVSNSTTGLLAMLIIGTPILWNWIAEFLF